METEGRLANGGSPLLFSGQRITRDFVVTDIAASEVKELVSGYSIIKANSLEEAVELSKGRPIFESSIDYVEVREVMKVAP